MFRISRWHLCLILFLLGSLVCVQTGPVPADDAAGPAPGEPTGSEAGDTPVVDAIAGTQPAAETEAPTAEESADLHAEIAELRAEIARLQADLKKLRADSVMLFAAVSEHAAAINDNTAGLAKHNDSLNSHDEQLTQTNQLLTVVQESQQDIEQRLRDTAGGGPSLSLLGNMQSDPNARGDLFQLARYRLRIHNTTGSEQPLFINGVQWTVRTDEWTYVPIPLGPVTIHRPGREPLEVAEDHVQWQSDNRGFYVDYDLDLHQVSVSPET